MSEMPPSPHSGQSHDFAPPVGVGEGAPRGEGAHQGPEQQRLEPAQLGETSGLPSYDFADQEAAVKEARGAVYAAHDAVPQPSVTEPHQDEPSRVIRPSTKPKSQGLVETIRRAVDTEPMAQMKKSLVNAFVWLGLVAKPKPDQPLTKRAVPRREPHHGAQARPKSPEPSPLDALPDNQAPVEPTETHLEKVFREARAELAAEDVEPPLDTVFRAGPRRTPTLPPQPKDDEVVDPDATPPDGDDELSTPKPPEPDEVWSIPPDESVPGTPDNAPDPDASPVAKPEKTKREILAELAEAARIQAKATEVLAAAALDDMRRRASQDAAAAALQPQGPERVAHRRHPLLERLDEDLKTESDSTRRGEIAMRSVITFGQELVDKLHRDGYLSWENVADGFNGVAQTYYEETKTSQDVLGVPQTNYHTRSGQRVRLLTARLRGVHLKNTSDPIRRTKDGALKGPSAAAFAIDTDGNLWRGVYDGARMLGESDFVDLRAAIGATSPADEMVVAEEGFNALKLMYFRITGQQYEIQ